MVDTTTMLAALLLGAIAGVVLLEQSIRRTSVGVGLVLATYLSGFVVEVEAIPLGPFSVFPADLTLGLIGVAGIARYLRCDELGWRNWVLLALLGLVFASIARGAGEHGVDAALNESRRFLYFGFGAIYGSTASFRTVTPEVRNRLADLLVAAAAVLTAVTVLRWFTLAVGYQAATWARSFEGGVRVIAAPDALVVAQAFLVSILAWLVTRGTRSITRMLTAAAFLAVIVLLAHRTVWIVCIIVLAVLTVRRPKIGLRFARVAVGAALVASVLLFTAFGGDGPSIGDQLENATTDPQTFEWRLEGWGQLLFTHGPSNAQEVALGLPFGSGYVREVRGVEVPFTPHNYYVETFLRVGGLGLVLFVVLYATTLRQLLRRDIEPEEPSLLSAELLALLCISQLLYFLTYHPNMEQGLVFGLAVAAATGRARTIRDRRGRMAGTPRYSVVAR